MLYVFLILYFNELIMIRQQGNGAFCTAHICGTSSKWVTLTVIWFIKWYWLHFFYNFWIEPGRLLEDIVEFVAIGLAHAFCEWHISLMKILRVVYWPFKWHTVWASMCWRITIDRDSVGKNVLKWWNYQPPHASFLLHPSHMMLSFFMKLTYSKRFGEYIV